MSASNGTLPEISIVLLTKNAGVGLERTLAKILEQRTSRGFELLAVDSGSTDRTLETLDRFHVRVHRIQPDEFNFGKTRELGYGLACGNYLATLSQDSVPTSDKWLDKLTAPFDDPDVAAVAGATILPPPPRRIFYWERIGRFYFTRLSTRWLAKYHFAYSNTNSAVRKAVWEQNRLGPIEMCEDRLLQKTWSALGLKIVFAPEALVYHAHDYDLTGLVRRCEKEGEGNRVLGEAYSLVDSLSDMVNIENWSVLGAYIARGARPTRAELLFPLVRPFFLWNGHRRTKNRTLG
jgi:glycosyltransferase involved in cell wall biosynthesis